MSEQESGKEGSAKKIKKIPKTNIMEKYEKAHIEYCRLHRSSDLQTLVYLVSIEKKPEFVLKKKILEPSNDGKMDNLLREYNINRFMGLISDNAVKAFDLRDEIITKKGDKKIVVEILTEYGGDTLSNIMNSLSKEETTKILQQLIKVLALLESVGIAHFDIKPLNLVWNRSTSLLKLIDYGTAIVFYKNPQLISQNLEEQYFSRFSGFTRFYAPPEIVEKKWVSSDIIPSKFDVYCFGMTVYEIFHFEIKHKPLTLAKNNKALISGLKDLLVNSDRKDWMTLVLSCLEYTPDMRPSFKKINEICNGETNPEQNSRKNRIDEIENCLISGDFDAAIWLCKEHLISRVNIISAIERVYVFNMLVTANCKIGNYATTIDRCFDIINNLSETLNENPKEKIKLYNNLGESFYMLKNINEALEYYQEALKLTKMIYEEDDIRIAKCFNNIAVIYRSMGEKELSINYCKEAIKIIKQKYGEKDETIVHSYNVLGIIYSNDNQFNLAISLFSKSIELIKELNGNNDFKLASIYFNLGSVYNHMHRFSTAILYYNESIKIIKKKYGDDYYLLVYLYSKIGECESCLDRFEASVSYITKAKELAKRYYTENHPFFSSLHCGSAFIYLSLGQKEKALFFCNKSIEIIKNYYREETERFVDPYLITALIYYCYCESDNAIYYFNEVIKVLKKSNKSSDLKYACAYNGLGHVYADLMQAETALSYFRESMRIIKELDENANENQNLAETYKGIGDVYLSLNQLEVAKNYYNEALKIRKLMGEEALLALIYSNLAKISFIQNQEENSRELSRNAIKILQNCFGEDHFLIGVEYFNIGLTYDNKQDQVKECIEYYQKGAEILSKCCSDKNSSDLYMIYDRLGLVYYKSYDYPKTIYYLNMCLEVAKETWGNESKKVVGVLAELGNLHFKINKFDASLEYCNEAMRIINLTSEKESANHGLVHLYLSDVLIRMNDFNSALEHAFEALRLNTKFYGAKSTFTALSYNNIGALYFLLYQYEDAVKYLCEGIDIIKKNEGENDIKLNIPLSYLAQTYFKLGKYELSLECGEKAQILFIAEFGEKCNSPLLVEIYNIMSSLYFNDQEEGRNFFYSSKMLEILETQSIYHDSEMYLHYYHLGNGYMKLNKYKNAIENYEEAVRRVTEKYGTNFRLLANIYVCISQSLFNLGNFEQAIKYSFESCRVIKSYNEADRKIWDNYQNIAICYLKMGKHDLAMKHIMEVKKSSEQVLGKENVIIGFLCQLEGKIHFVRKQWNDAKESYIETLRIARKYYNEKDINVVAILLNLGQTCFNKKDYKESDQYFAEALNAAKLGGTGKVLLNKILSYMNTNKNAKET